MAERPAQDATSFVAPEGPYVLVDQFVVPTLPALPQAQQPPAFVFPRLSTVSVRYPATKANRSEKAAAAAAAATVAANSGSEGGGAGLVDSSAGSDASTSGDATAQGTAGAEAGRHFAGAAYPFLESTLAAQGIDAPASVLPGAPALGGMSLGLGSVGLGLGRSGTKASRPKNNIKTTSSSFVNRIQSHEQLTKILAQRTDADVFAFLNAGKSFLWMADTTGKIKEPLARITFSAFPTCHDVNQFTRSHERLDVIIGFSTGDVIWFDPMASRYARINKGGVISASPCVQVRWMPGSESLFMTAHQDGCMIVYDKDREDALSFVPTSFIPPPTLATVQEGSGTTPGYFKEEEQQEVLRAEGLSPDIPGRPGLGARIPTNSTTSSVGMPAGSLSSIISTAGEVRATASENGSTTSAARNRPTWNPRTTMIVTRPGAGNAAGLGAKTGMMGGTGVSGKGKETPWAKMNPVTHWRVSRKRITGAISSGLRHMRSRRFLMLTSHFPPSLVDFAFSPDLVHVAVVSEDGILRVVDLTTERLLDTFESYFGGFNCVCWSPDGRFLLTGGQDDLITVWAPREGRVIARCQGHTSFVTGIAFDPWRWRPDGRTYRFASVGEDCKIILWDFSSAALHRPKTHGNNASHGAARRSSMGSTLSLLDRYGHNRPSSSTRRQSSGMDRPMPMSGSGSAIASAQGYGATNHEAIAHTAPPKSEVAILQPVVIKQLEGETLTCVRFRPDGILAMHRSGSIKMFARPAPRVGTTQNRSASGSTYANGQIPAHAQSQAQGQTQTQSQAQAQSQAQNGQSQQEQQLQQQQQQQQATTPSTPTAGPKSRMTLGLGLGMGRERGTSVTA